MATHEKTLKLVTNLDRKAIEERLAAVRNAAQSAGLADVAGLLSGLEGKSRADIEAKVLAALERLRRATLDDLLPLVYDDVPARIHRVAARSLTAHLDKLTLDGTVRSADDKYSLVESARAR